VLQWTIVGAVLLLFVFIGSTQFTESISLSRYPEYAEYQRRTSPVVPWIPGRGGPAMPPHDPAEEPAGEAG
jgi:steroid 5-alpha reductase family enzyme